MKRIKKKEKVGICKNNLCIIKDKPVKMTDKVLVCPNCGGELVIEEKSKHVGEIRDL